MNERSGASADRQMDRIWKVWESSIVVLFLVMFSEGLVQRLISPSETPDGSLLLRVLWLPAYAWALIMSAVNWRNMIRIGARNPFLLLLTGLTLVSVVWSIDPGVTLRRSVALVCTTLFGVYLAARFSWPEVLRLFGWAWLIVAGANLVVSGAFPGIGVDHDLHIGAWKGLFVEKNAMGGAFSRASFLFIVLLAADKRYRAPWVAGLAISFLLILMSTSKTALLGMLIGVAALVASIFIKRGAGHAIGLIWASVIVVLALALGLVFAPGVLFGLIGRDASLTGRTDIWEALATSISQRPWLGYGYGAFWGPDSIPARWVRIAVQWEAPTAHNGWLEVLLAVGGIGLACLVLNLANISIRAALSLTTGWGGVFAAGFLLQFLLFSMSESIAIQQNSITWLTYAVVAGRLAMDSHFRHNSRLGAAPLLSGRSPEARRAIKA
ncbi:MAG: O-antigen ligase family protein [Hyphomonas sp.]|uniref:O-antigen ligase family protein n=1 Tax=Hyphomonas sp. TaxID=87 RepID=UPI003527E716